MDALLSSDVEAASMVDELFDYCKAESIDSPEELEKALNADRLFYLRTKGRSPVYRVLKSNSKSIAAAILFLLSLAIGFLWNQRPDFQPGFAGFHAIEKERINEAGDGLETWENYFVQEEFDKMITEIETLIAGNPKSHPRPLFYLCAVYMWQTPPNLARLQVLLPRITPTYSDDIWDIYRATGLNIDEQYLPPK